MPGQKIAAQPIDQTPKRRLIRACRQRDGLKTVTYIPNILGQHRERGAMNRSVVQELIRTSRHVGKEALQSIGGVLTRTRRRQLTRPFLQVAVQNARRDEPSVEQRAEPSAQTPLAKLRKHEGDVVVLARVRPRDSKRAIERLLHETRHLGLVGQSEARIDVRFQWKLAQQRQAEGVDRRDGDVAQSLPQIAPSFGIELGGPAGFPQPLHDALAHFGGGLASEGDGQDVVGIDAGKEQVDVPLDQHPRLAGARRSLKHDVLRWIDGGLPRGFVRRHRRSPSGKPSRKCTSRSDAHRLAPAENGRR